MADGVFFPLESIVSFKLDKVIGQGTMFPGGLYSSSFGFFMNEDKWNKLAKQDQAIIEKYGCEYAARSNGQSWDKADQVGPERAQGGRRASIVTADADDAGRGEEALRPDHRGLDQEGERQGRRRQGGARRVPRRAEKGRCK